ncbi:MAG: DUF3800 domain-containing protein [Lachnospiraceae bacterium]|nr:DUF3800 domain-containing protein [Lachnospiraceae bacterium]
MDLFVYSDESGVFDCRHSKYFVFGGLLFLDAETMQSASRRYQSYESAVRSRLSIPQSEEIKACNLPINDRRLLLRATNREFRFGIVIEIADLKIRWIIADDKKSRQRYMDFAYKIAVKRFMSSLIYDGAIKPNEVRTVHFFTDQHNTATNGRYELEEALEQELIRGTINFETQDHYLPLFPKAKSVTVKYCDSKKVALIRAADIVANKIYAQANLDRIVYEEKPTFYVCHLPDRK